MKKTVLYKNDIEISDDLWLEIEKRIPGVKGKWGGIGEQNRDFVTTVLYLAKNKLRRSQSLDWYNIKENRASYNRRFTNWRKKGIWEDVLCILLQHKEFYWLADPFIYSVFLTNYKLLTAINKLFLLTSDEIQEYYDKNDKELGEAKWRDKQLFKHVMQNRERRIKYGAENGRKAYTKKYTPEEIVKLRELDEIFVSKNAIKKDG